MSGIDKAKRSVISGSNFFNMPSDKKRMDIHEKAHGKWHTKIMKALIKEGNNFEDAHAKAARQQKGKAKNPSVSFVL